MKLNAAGLRDTALWQQAGIALPAFDWHSMCAATEKAPTWVHFGAGNIFRGFIASLQQSLLEQGLTASGLIAAETFDADIIDRIYEPHDSMTLTVSLRPDGSTGKAVVASIARGLKANPAEAAHWAALKAIFQNPSLQMVSYTITEKGYALRDMQGELLPSALADMQCGPDTPHHAMGVTAALLLARYQACAAPIAVVSMDNCSHNGEKLRQGVTEMARCWQQKRLVPQGFCTWLEDEGIVSFPWTMIDKITPRPSTDIADALEQDGVESMQPVITAKHTYIAPFVNAEGPQYLVVEDNFPNGRPPLEKAGVYMADRLTVNRSERMKVTACLNPIHTALGPYDVLLGYELFADGMSDPQLSRLANQVGYAEGLPVVEDPGILSPKAFIDEVIHERFPNAYLGDTSQRICTDISQGVAFRFGETIKAYVEREGSAERLIGIPVAIAGWLRYLLAVDDKGGCYPLAPDPMADELTSQLAAIRVGAPESYAGQLRPILENDIIWGVNLYAAGLGEKIEAIFREQLAGPGAVRATLKKYLG